MLPGNRLLASHPAPPPKASVKQVHDSTALVESAIKHINRPRWLWFGKRLYYGVWRKNWLFAKVATQLDDLKKLTDKDLIKTLIILDTVFFDGLLSPYTVVEWAVLPVGTGGDTSTQLNASGKVTIRMSSQRVYFAKLSPTEAIISTLLHEMCHAYINLYACFGESCGQQECTFGHQHYLETIGPTGHGRSWQILAAAIENRAKEVLGINLDLNRAAGARQDLAMGNTWLRIEDILRLFGLATLSFLPLQPTNWLHLR